MKMKVTGGKILKWWNFERFSFNSPRETRLIYSSNLRQLLPSLLCSSFAPHPDPMHSVEFLLFPLLKCPLYPFFSLTPRQTALLSHTLLSNLWTTQIYFSTFCWIRSPRLGASRLNIWQGLPSAASGHSGAASSGGKAEVQRRVSELT